MNIFGLLAFFVATLCAVDAYSWISCTDYDGTINDATYDHNKCRGWPRSGFYYTPKTASFGEETGYGHTPTDTNMCRTIRNDHCGYTDDHRMAQYYVGQTVVITHPIKTRGNDAACDEFFNADDGNFIYGLPTTAGSTSNPNSATILAAQIADLGVSPVKGKPGVTDAMLSVYPKDGFQNAPAFCADKDNALATNQFTIPGSWAPGMYTFVWLTYVGSVGELSNAQSTCWEAYVHADQATAAAARAAPAPAVQQDVAVTFDNFWGTGANGQIDVPASPLTVQIVVTFPTPVSSFTVSGATNTGTAAEEAAGIYRLEFGGLWIPENTFGFNLAFSNSVPCGMSAADIKTVLEPKITNPPVPGQQDVAVTYTGEWGTGAVGDIDISTLGSNTLVVTFPIDVDVFTVWDANMVEVGANTYNITRLPWATTAGFVVLFKQSAACSPCFTPAITISAIIV